MLSHFFLTTISEHLLDQVRTPYTEHGLNTFLTSQLSFSSSKQSLRSLHSQTALIFTFKNCLLHSPCPLPENYSSLVCPHVKARRQCLVATGIMVSEDRLQEDIYLFWPHSTQFVRGHTEQLLLLPWMTSVTEVVSGIKTRSPDPRLSVMLFLAQFACRFKLGND